MLDQAVYEFGTIHVTAHCSLNYKQFLCLKDAASFIITIKESKTVRNIQGADDKLGQTLRTHLKQ